MNWFEKPHIRVANDDDPDADLVEIRLDQSWQAVPSEEEAADLLLASGHGPLPRLATLRPRRQGGAFEGPEEVRVSLLAAAQEAGFAAVDLEADLREVATLVHGFRVPCIVSDHTLPDAPSAEDGLRRLQLMQDAGGLLQKLAFPVGSFLDGVRALQLANQHAQRNGRPVIAPLGGGASLRALLALAGNAATYGHAKSAKPAVAGQPALGDMQRIWDHWGTTPGGSGAPWYAVLGSNVGGSLSPRIHNAAFTAAGRPARYGALDVPASPGAFRLLAKAATRIGLAGASVTNPHKLTCLDVGEPDATAAEVGAANCIRFDSFACTNTDATALARMLAGEADVLVMGAGGAARAAIWAAKQNGATVHFTSRDADRAAAVADAFDVPWIEWNARHEAEAGCIVQATTVSDQNVVPHKVLQRSSRLVELVYQDGPTATELAARDAGLRVQGGKVLLLEQAIDAFSFWTGQAPDRSAMEAVL